MTSPSNWTKTTTWSSPWRRKNESKDEDKKNGRYLRREFSYSKFQQTMILPDDVEKDKISASVEHGVLTIDLPKVSQEEAKKAERHIDIK